MSTIPITNWQIACDPENRGRDELWYDRIGSDAQPAPVPGIIQQVFPAYHGVAWYWAVFTLEALPQPDEHVLLRFGAVDYFADVWVNGAAVGGHEGGETPFELDATTAVHAGDNLLAVRVLNPMDTPIDGMTLEETPHGNKLSEPQ
jgi:beta-galactosidase/beta-glucuronidase